MFVSTQSSSTKDTPDWPIRRRLLELRKKPNDIEKLHIQDLHSLDQAEPLQRFRGVPAKRPTKILWAIMPALTVFLDFVSN